jgi:hypothetical protein
LSAVVVDAEMKFHDVLNIANKVENLNADKAALDRGPPSNETRGIFNSINKKHAEVISKAGERKFEHF